MSNLHKNRRLFSQQGVRYQVLPKIRIVLIIILGFWTLLTVNVPAANAEEGEKPVWLVVTRPMFVEAIQPLADERGKEGFETVISTSSFAEAIEALKRRPAFILLVGDYQPGEEKEPWYVPSRWEKACLWWFRQKKEFVSDAVLGDFDGDSVPDVPVGRIPVRTTEQLEKVVAKILAFENRKPTLDDLRIPVWIGSPRYSPRMDVVVSGFLLNTVRANAPVWAEMWLISPDIGHPLCGWPPLQEELFTEQFRRGGVMATLIGHGFEYCFFATNFNRRYIRYTADNASSALAEGQPGPPMVIYACSCGDFAWRQCDSLSESLLLAPGGPVAVIGATEVSHPLTNYYSSQCLLWGLRGKERRLGRVWLLAQQRGMKLRNFIIERALLEVDGKLKDKNHIAMVRRDHNLMYAILGDPATRLHLPDRLKCNIEYRPDGWYWEVNKPEGATKLHVGLRPQIKSFHRFQEPLEKGPVLERFYKANAAFAFEPLDELDGKVAWKGKIDTEGTLRIVATGPGRIYVAAFELKFPDEKPSADIKPE